MSFYPGMQVGVDRELKGVPITAVRLMTSLVSNVHLNITHLVKPTTALGSTCKLYMTTHPNGFSTIPDADMAIFKMSDCLNVRPQR